MRLRHRWSSHLLQYHESAWCRPTLTSGGTWSTGYSTVSADEQINNDFNLNHDLICPSLIISTSSGLTVILRLCQSILRVVLSIKIHAILCISVIVLASYILLMCKFYTRNKHNKHVHVIMYEFIHAPL